VKKAITVVLWAILSTTCAWAQQVCQPGIPLTTPTADFTDHGNGTVTHRPTALMWKQCLEGLDGEGCANGTASEYSWKQALQIADGHIYAEYSDWRLPNIRELSSITEQSCYDPAINLDVFPKDPPVSGVWSSSPYAYGLDVAWYLSFHGGMVSYNVRHYDKQVRLVRGGQ